MAFHNFNPYEQPLQQGTPNGTHDISSFVNQIPIDYDQASSTYPKRLKRRVNVSTSPSSIPSVDHKTVIRSLYLPVLALVLPIAVLSAALLAIIFGRYLETQTSLFPLTNTIPPQNSQYILVDYPATQLVFIASFLSTLAPILAGFVMALWTLPVARRIRNASVDGHYADLPTPYQLSLIVGLTHAEGLRRYVMYCLSGRNARSRVPAVVHYAASMLILSIFLAILVFLSDTGLHWTTSTIAFNKISISNEPVYSLGRGLSEFCLTFNRSSNRGFPCSYNANGRDANAVIELNESFKIQHNTSSISEIRLVESPDASQGTLAVLIPQSQGLVSNLDYSASTIGVSTQCTPVTGQCHMKVLRDNLRTQFNCSNSFYGVLGKVPNITEIAGPILDPDVPPLGFKPASNLQYGFFTNLTLNNTYNSVGYNTTTDSLPKVSTALPDGQLQNPIYMGVAARISSGSESNGLPLNKDANMFDSGNQSYVDFALQCSITSYEVTYSWVNGSIQGCSPIISPNGTLVEIFHARQFYTSISGGGYDLEDYLALASLQNTSVNVAESYANSFSVKVLATIGGYTTSRINIQEQTRTQLLVAQVQKWALGCLVATSLCYTVLGLILLYTALAASGQDVLDISQKLSLAGLTAAAFSEPSSAVASASTGSFGTSLSEKITRVETRRVGADGDVASGYGFRVWV